jgi:hypothetical protein
MKRFTSIIAVSVLLLVSLSHAQMTWARTYGETGSDQGQSVQQTSDGGYVVTGTTFSPENGFQAYLFQTNASGDTLWTRNYGGADLEEGYSVQQTMDGGYVVAGASGVFGQEQVYLIKTNTAGDTLWTRTWGGVDIDYGQSVQQTADTGYVVAGWSLSFEPGAQVYLIKTNALGDTLWTRTYGGDGDQYGYSVQQTSDGGYVIAGTYYLGGNSYQVYLIKTNASGDTLWTKIYGGTGIEYGTDVRQTKEGGYIVTGWTDSYGDAQQVYLVKTDSLGDTLWTKTYGGTDNENGQSVRQTTDEGYIIAGYTSSFGQGNQDVYLIKTDASGDTLWTRTFGGTETDYGRSVRQTSDSGYIIAGRSLSFGGGERVYLMKTDANGDVGIEEEGGRGPSVTNQGVIVTPNPFTSLACIPGHEAERFDLYDITGKRVGACRGDRVGEKLSPGVYFVSPKEASNQSFRVVKVK